MPLLAALPIAGLIVFLLILKFSVARSGALALGMSLIVAFAFFGFTVSGLLIAAGKAFWLALFVSLIVWFALFLYHLLSDFGAVNVINLSISSFIKDEFIAFLLLAWLFTGLLQGIAGFGVPAVIVAPILVALKFNPVKSVAASLLGHSWAITFGSMGAAFFVIQGLTDIPPEQLGFPMWVFNSITILGTGIGVSFLHSGVRGIARGIPYVLPTAAFMSLVQYFVLVQFGMYSLGTIVPALVGLFVLFVLYKIFPRKSIEQPESSPIDNSGRKLTLLQATLPYIAVLALLLSFQFIPEDVRNAAAISPSFPGSETTIAEPHVVSPEENYNPIRLFVHPAGALLLASIVAVLIFKKAGVWDKAKFTAATKMTVKKGIPATLALLAFGNMSLVMMDSGMMPNLASAVARVTGNAYPFASPYVGSLASFLTGNNTNSNVMFGVFQQTIATELSESGAVAASSQVAEAIMTSSQSISGALGCAIASTLVLMAALATKQTENVSTILKKLIPIVLIVAAVMGVANFLMLNYL